VVIAEIAINVFSFMNIVLKRKDKEEMLDVEFRIFYFFGGRGLFLCASSVAKHALTFIVRGTIQPVNLVQHFLTIL
jgi:hypothetical protein